MKKSTNILTLGLAIIGVASLVYGAWYLLQLHDAQNQSHSMLAAPAPSGLPDIFHDAPPPKQP
jgi:hypothetical protein